MRKRMVRTGPIIDGVLVAVAASGTPVLVDQQAGATRTEVSACLVRERIRGDLVRSNRRIAND